MRNPTNIIPPRVPFLDEKTSLISREWYRFFFNLFMMVKGNYEVLPTDIVVDTSPFLYINTTNGNVDVMISGGGISTLEFSRDGTTFYDTGSYYGMFSLSPSDMLRVTYVSAPVMTLIQR